MTSDNNEDLLRWMHEEGGVIFCLSPVRTFDCMWAGGRYVDAYYWAIRGSLECL